MLGNTSKLVFIVLALAFPGLSQSSSDALALEQQGKVAEAADVWRAVTESNPRDAAGLAIDVAMDPTNQIHFKQHIWWDAGRIYFTLLDLRAQNYQTIQGIQRSSVDYYSSLRNLYRQMRAEQIRNGRPIRQDLPDF